jgi:hypothetical protein
MGLLEIKLFVPINFRIISIFAMNVHYFYTNKKDFVGWMWCALLWFQLLGRWRWEDHTLGQLGTNLKPYLKNK